jgi:rfaE bifunctional protein kinase chain/domain
MTGKTMKVTKTPGKRRLLELIERFVDIPVAVLGDLVLDEFIYGEIARVSREAPVLILDHRESRISPGGAANAVANLKALGARPLPVGRLGRDADADRLQGLLEGLGVSCSGIVRDGAHATPVKSRILAGSAHTAKQQIVRLDRGGSPALPSTETRGRISRKLSRLGESAAGLLLADYGYGSVSPSDPEVKRWIRSGRRPITLDSRFRMLDFPGVTAATPNIAEVEAALGEALPDDDLPAIERAATTLRNRMRSPALVVTRGSRGMSLVERDNRPVHLPVYGTDEVADVTGAGDTVAATFILTLLAGGSYLEATILANYAGGIVVTKRATATVGPVELSAAVEGDE